MTDDTETDPRLRDQLTDHEHEWMAWARPSVQRDSLGVVIAGLNLSIQWLHVARPVTPGWWRTCRTCPTEELSGAAEVEARVQAAAAQARQDGIEEGRGDLEHYERDWQAAAAQRAAEELEAVAEDLLGFGDTAPSKQQVHLAAWLQATADNLRAAALAQPADGDGET